MCSSDLSLPVLNKEAVRKAISFGATVNATINKRSRVRSEIVGRNGTLQRYKSNKRLIGKGQNNRSGDHLGSPLFKLKRLAKVDLIIRSAVCIQLIGDLK